MIQLDIVCSVKTSLSGTRMQNLFNFNSGTSLPTVQAGFWDYTRTGLHGSLERIRRYYRVSPFAVESDHFLIRLLHSINIPKSLSAERYYDNVDGLFSLNLAMALKMTSSISTGHLFDGTFYGPGCKEILIAHTQSFDPVKANERWRDLAAVRVLRHPISDLSMSLPDGKANSTDTGIAVIAINVPLLAIQYRAWWKEEYYLSQLYNESPHSIMQFIHMYVLPNMLPSHLDYVLFNRISNLSQGSAQGEAKRKHPFYVTDFSQRIDQVQTTMLTNLARMTKDFVGILHNIPAVTAPDMNVVMRLPGMAPTRQVMWALGIARFPTLDFLTRISLRGGFTKNGQEVNQIRQTFRNYVSGSVMKNVLKGEVLTEVESEIAAIQSRLI